MSLNSSESDISSFAEWEALHQPLAKDSERERSLADMARPERVWRDRDSSNDARSLSSSSEDESLEDEVKLEVRQGKGGKGKNGLGKRELVIPSSTAETVSQELVSYSGFEEIAGLWERMSSNMRS
jgi:hypothetical protein